MNQKRYLYKVSTVGLGDYHVVATNMDSAAKAIEQYLDHHKYGYSLKRRVHGVNIVTEVIDFEKPPMETSKLLIIP
jgi:hypothetical protein